MTTSADSIAQTILVYLKKRGESQLVIDVVETLKNSPEYRNARNHVVVTSAVSLDEEELKGLRSYLDKTLGKSYELLESVDPSLVAGFTLQVNDTFIDASVLGKINLVSNKLSAKD